MRRLHVWVVGLIAWLALGFAAAPAGAQAPTSNPDKPYQIYILTWRGCEEICVAFKESIESQNIPAEFTIRSIEQNRANAPQYVEEIRTLHPDLVVTWGTVVTLQVVGPLDAVDSAKHITDIPVVYLNVTDPVGSKIARSYQFSGRHNVAGGNVDVPISAQVKTIKAYRTVQRIGVIYGTDEPASVANVRQLKEVLDEEKIELVEVTLPLGDNGKPTPESIPEAIAKMKELKPDFLYYVASSFLIGNLEPFTRGVVEQGMPLFSAYELPMRRGYALLGLLSTLRNIAQVGAYQAVEILVKKKNPLEMPSLTLSRFTVMINMKVARDLEVYPPIKLMQFAELFER